MPWLPGFWYEGLNQAPGSFYDSANATPCNECKGTGDTINDKDRCPQCKGEKVVQGKKVLEVIVEKGMQNGQKITFPGETDEAVCFII